MGFEQAETITQIAVEMEASEPATSSKQIRKVGTFWSLDRTESTMRLLDIWASVWRARKLGQLSIPKADAIFERPIPNLAEFIDPRTQLRVIDWAIFRKDQTTRLDSPEETAFLAVEKLLKDQHLKRYIPILLTYFPRQGVYRDRHMLPIEPGYMSNADQLVLGDVIKASRSRR